jgi:predicted alpha-1,2-mannosidase
MKRILLFFFATSTLSSYSQIVNKSFDPVEFVNPLMGTQSKPSLSNGNTYPAVGVPWGMNLWSPQTGKMGNGWMYAYTDDMIRGFKQTHQPSPWMNDYGQFSIMPVNGLKLDEDLRASWFSHKAEVSKPYYYSVYLADHNITTEITPTERAAHFRFTFGASDSSYVIIDAFDKGSYVKIIPSERKIVGFSSKHSRGLYTDFKNYFVIQFDEDFLSCGVWDGKSYTKLNQKAGDRTAAVIGFKTKRGDIITAKVASSFISIEQAQLNLDREISQLTFEQTSAKAKAEWNEKLSKIKVEGGTETEMKTFYSCLYRTLLFPNKLYEINKNNEIIHWSPYSEKIMPGRMFAGTGFWDTFRALYPFLNLTYPSINKEMQEGLVNAYKEGGWLPEWSSPGYANSMVGNNSASVVADAYIKGGTGYDINTLWEAVKHGANNEGPLEAVGRDGVKYYNELGYVPYDVKVKENAAKTLEYAYDDFAIYQLGKALNKPESEIAIYKKRAMNYKNLFDSVSGLMQAKIRMGLFKVPLILLNGEVLLPKVTVGIIHGRSFKMWTD